MRLNYGMSLTHRSKIPKQTCSLRNLTQRTPAFRLNEILTSHAMSSNTVISSLLTAQAGKKLLPKALQKKDLAKNWIAPFKLKTARKEALHIKKMGLLIILPLILIMVSGMVALPLLIIGGEQEPSVFNMILAFWSMIAGPIFMMTLANSLIHIIPSVRYSYHADTLINSFKLLGQKAPSLEEIGQNYDLNALSLFSMKRSLMGSCVLLIPTVPLVLLAYL